MVSYASAVRALAGLCRHQIAAITNESGIGLSLKFDDPLIKFLVKKSLALSKTDTELYQNWLETRLVALEDKPLIFSGTWSDENIDFLAGEASAEWEWLLVHDEATKREEEYAEMIGRSRYKGTEHKERPIYFCVMLSKVSCDILS